MGHFDTENGGNRYTNLRGFFPVLAEVGFLVGVESGVVSVSLIHINLYNIYIYR